MSFQPIEIRIGKKSRLAWQLKGAVEVTAEEALNLYERNWRHVDRDKLTAREKRFIKSLLTKLA